MSAATDAEAVLTRAGGFHAGCRREAPRKMPFMARNQTPSREWQTLLAGARHSGPVGSLQHVLGCIWAAPYTAVGLMLGAVAVLFGGWWRVRTGVIEFGGGAIGRWAASRPPPFAFVAITFGHVILGIDDATLDAVRDHEQVHVRQYERWGPLFGPAYLWSSLLQLLRGRRAYLDNWFEREARARAAAIAADRQHPADSPDDLPSGGS